MHSRSPTNFQTILKNCGCHSFVWVGKNSRNSSLLTIACIYTSLYILSKVVKSLGKLWQNNCSHTRSCWWSLNKWEIVIAFHIASLIVLLTLVLSWCVFFFYILQVLFGISSWNWGNIFHVNLVVILVTLIMCKEIFQYSWEFFFWQGYTSNDNGCYSY
jgi:hypothetical protein